MLSDGMDDGMIWKVVLHNLHLDLVIHGFARSIIWLSEVTFDNY
jgi:hypothetical protein